MPRPGRVANEALDQRQAAERGDEVLFEVGIAGGEGGGVGGLAGLAQSEI